MRKTDTDIVGRRETTARVELGGPGTRVGRAARDGRAPACYGGRGARRGLEGIAEGMAGLVLDGDDGPVGMVDEGVGDLWEHGDGGMHTRCSQLHFQSNGDGAGARVGAEPGEAEEMVDVEVKV